MFKKTFFVSTAALLLCFLASCSFINTSDTSASVSLNLARSVSGHVEYDYIDVFLQGDSTQTKRISADESTVTFDELPNGASVYIKADAYQNGELIYTGQSETIKVKSGENTVSLTLKRIYSVKFKLNFDDEGIYAEQRIISGEYAKQPEDPAKVEEATSSFKFEGWFELDSQEAFDFENTPIKKDLVLYARWAKPETKYYTVSFNTNGGKGSFEDQTVIEGNKASKPEVESTRETDDEAGYEFAGWFTSEDNGITLADEPFDFNTAITADITLYAGWKVIPYVTVTFNVNGGKGDYEKQRVLKGTIITKPATNPTKDADAEHTYNFLNWSISPDGDENPFDFSQPITSDVELYAVWTTEEIYTVTFNLNGGNGTNFEQNVIANEKINPPASNPERAADEVYEYSFAGWYTSEDDGKTLSTSPFDFENTPVTRNLVLYAGWTKTEIIYYYVYFNTLQSGSMIEDQRVVQGGYAKEPSTMPVRPNQEKVKYIFDGWYISTDSGITFADKPFDFKNTPITNTITLFAKWTEVHYYYVDFNTLEGGGAIESQLIIEGGYAEKPSTTPIRTNDDTHTYTFDGWFTSTDKGKTFADTSFDFANTPITSDITLYAKWTVTEYFYVSFNTMGGNGTFINQKIQKGETATEPGVGPTKTSTSEYIYTFAGWYTSDDGGKTLSSTPYNFATPVTKAITLYAKWISKKYCHVTFDVNGGDGTFKEQTIIEGNKASKPEDEPTRETDDEAGYKFAGWFTSKDNGITLADEAFDFNTAITDDLTLYAGWTLIPYVTATFNVNGVNGEYEEQRVLKGQTITKPETNPTKDADEEHTYNFLNWYVSTDGGETFASTAFDFSQPITGDIELYAVWTTKGIYTVTFNLNGGKGNNTEENVIAGEKVSAPSKAPEKETDEDYEYTFAGWFTSNDNGKTLSTTPFDFDTAITDNITLYAGWNTTPFYTVTFINRDGNETFQAQRILSGKTASRPETDPTRDSTESFDYTFIGWFISEDGGTTLSTTQFDFDTAITGDITLCAAWSVTIFHKVYFYTNGANQSIEPQRIQDGLPVSEPTTSLTKDSTESESYEFDGWYTSEDGGNTLSSTPYNFDTPITKNLALYAKWKVSVSSPFEVEIPLDEIKDVSVSIAENADKGTWIFTAETGYDTYKWKWDGETQTTTSNIFETPEDAVPGKYQLSLLATKVVDGKTEYYSFSERITIK